VNWDCKLVGQVLAHVAKENRLVVQVLIDGQEPDIEQFGRVRATPIDGRTIFIETANSAELAISVLDEVVDQLNSAEQSKQNSADLACSRGRPARRCASWASAFAPGSMRRNRS
jgi:hypothetical protein